MQPLKGHNFCELTRPGRPPSYEDVLPPPAAGDFGYLPEVTVGG